MAVDEKFTAQVAETLGELSGEKPTVSEQEMAEALELKDEASADALMEALNELASASVAVQVGISAESGRMWRHTGMTAEDAQAALDAERETARREAEREEEQAELAAQERAAEIERERLEAEGAGDDPAELATEGRVITRRAPAASTQTVELPMSVAGSLSPEAVGEIVQAGITAAKEAGVGFEFVVKAE